MTVTAEFREEPTRPLASSESALVAEPEVLEPRAMAHVELAEPAGATRQVNGPATVECESRAMTPA